MKYSTMKAECLINYQCIIKDKNAIGFFKKTVFLSDEYYSIVFSRSISQCDTDLLSSTTELWFNFLLWKKKNTNEIAVGPVQTTSNIFVRCSLFGTEIHFSCVIKRIQYGTEILFTMKSLEQI